MPRVQNRNSAEQKLKERIAFPMRLFWQNEIFEIGRELGLTYFDQFKNYWNMNHYQGALQIAKAIDDSQLEALVKTHPRPYGIPLGGFQGNCYTMTESGKLSFTSSWNLVKKNARTALKKWGDKAYGVLQALISKDGRAAYFDLVDEIERVLGYEFVPSYHLPRLAPMKLVFKTGSNKYPDWTIPSEIIPVVQNELSKFKRPSQLPSRTRTLSITLLSLEKQIGETVNEVVKARRHVDIIFKKAFGTKLFRQNEMAIIGIRGPCSNEEEFNNRILSLALLIDEIETKEIAGLIGTETAKGSINLIESFLKQKAQAFDSYPIKNLRMIMALRSKRFPIHRGHPQFLDALRYFGFETLSPDWQDLWEKLLSRYLDSLRRIVEMLLPLAQTKGNQEKH